MADSYPFDREYLVSEGRVLRQLLRGDQTVDAIAEVLGVDPPVVERVVQSLRGRYIVRVVDGLVAVEDADAVREELDQVLNLALTAPSAMKVLRLLRWAAEHLGRYRIVRRVLGSPGIRFFLRPLEVATDRDLERHVAMFLISFAVVGGDGIKDRKVRRIAWGAAAMFAWDAFLRMGADMEKAAIWSRNLHVASLDLNEEARKRLEQAEQRETRLANMTERLVGMTDGLLTLTRWLVALGVLSIVAAVAALILSG